MLGGQFTLSTRQALMVVGAWKGANGYVLESEPARLKEGAMISSWGSGMDSGDSSTERTMGVLAGHPACCLRRGSSVALGFVQLPLSAE